MKNPLVSAMKGVEEALAYASRYALGHDFTRYCDLQTVIGLTEDDIKRRPRMASPYIFVTEEGHYASVFEVEGTYCLFNEQQAITEEERRDKALFSNYVQRLHTLLTSEFQDVGHKLSFVFERDPDKAEEELRKLLSHQYRGLKRMGLDLSDILDERIEKMAPFVARERAFLVVYTAREAISSSEIRDEEKRREAVMKSAPGARYGQNPLFHELEGLKIRHDTFVTTLESQFCQGDFGTRIRLMDAREFGLDLREEVERESTSPDWRPFLPGDVTWPHGVPKGDDHSTLLAPHLRYQLFNSEPKVEGNFVRLDGYWHATLALSLGPQHPETFSELFSKMSRHLPWRIRMDLMPNGLKILGGKKVVLSMAALLPPLRPVYNSVQWLEEASKSDPVCAMTICASTWGRTKETTKRNRTLLQKGLQSWGVCEVTSTFGDPLGAWVATLAGANALSIPSMMFPPLSAALALLPLQRPNTPWADDASIVFSTPDGKIFPVKLASTLQTKFTEIVAGEPGTGKSVALGALSEAILFSGQNSLPFLSYVDKGFSALGVIRLIQDALPPERKHEAVGLVLENSRNHCKNPFDVQLGMKYPLSPEKEYLVNICETLCVNPESGIPPNAQDCRQILSKIIDTAYENNADKDPIRYAPTLEPDVDAALEKTGLNHKFDEHWWKKATWYEVRDMLFAKGEIKAATRAHYQAMPELSDLQVYLNDADVRMQFDSITRDGSGETLLSYIGRCLSDALGTYKMLASRTVFELNSDTRVIAIDLNNVVGGKTRSGQVKTGLMYLYAGQLAAGHYELPQYRNELMEHLPEMYRPFHHERLTQLAQEVKTKIYDELHNAKDIPFIMNKLVTQDLENRKFFIRTVLSSQYLNHFPQEILKSANSMYLMQISHEDLPLLTEHFGVPAHTAQAFRHIGSGASPDGSGTHFLACFRLKTGRVVQILKNTLGPKELWALNSTPKDAQLRDQLYDRLDGTTARSILAAAFPTGSAERLIDLRQKEAKETDHSNVINRLASELIAKRGLQI
ncbi:ATP-binding protein [Serratia fonticola]|uniref:ATP-binding protein n=1 Tax=Serratia fonticola TaxID=47917 RepID=A0AAW3WW27_SERFO|nr:ATP-binding protein [Serratia fonticola]MBC3214627.1 ATP-binding protein [Serratia fonticola]NYA15172.1 ATP-binding protein [Serratia fonticola]NYA35368.1 ATP-binding protein [Serratia fonticola]